MFPWNSLAFSMIQWMLAIWSLVSLPFLKPAWTSGSSQFMYCWSLAWRILNITLLACEMNAIMLQFMGLQRVGHNWATELNWTVNDYCIYVYHTHLEPDILEYEVKWALGSITTNKASGDDRIPAELFHILKDDAMKMLHSIRQQTWKTAMVTGLEKVNFHSNPKERECQRMFKLLHNGTHLTR